MFELKRFSLLPIFVLGLAVSQCTTTYDLSDIDHTESIRINQVGFFPDADKTFVLADQKASTFHVLDESGRSVHLGEFTNFGEWEPSGEQILKGEFSKLNKEGSYQIYIPEIGKSYSFDISNQIYSTAAVDAIRSFFFQRVGIDLEEEHLGSWARKAGHPDDTCWFHPSSGYDEGFISSPGGWYDAGDYGKYIINASIATGTMLAFNELYPDYFPDASLEIPESGNGINDLLDEIRYELEWMLTMQDSDGGVFHKLTSLRHDGITMPDETHSPRFIIGKSTAASLDFAATIAQAARLYKELDGSFADRCLKSSISAYHWALNNPEEYYAHNPEGIGTGAYNDVVLKEEFFWAAAELYATTGKEWAYNTIKAELGNITFRLEESWRNYVDNIGYYSLFASGILSPEDQEILNKGIIHLADSMALLADQNAYQTPVSRFAWGSNSDVINNAIIQLYAFEVSAEEKYLNEALAYTDYILGKNATGYSFVSGYGEKASKYFHHRLFMADDRHDEAFPGFVAGGPNVFRQDEQNLMKWSKVSYPDTLPAKSYIDHDGSYASNEICLNWNAPLVFVLAYLDKHFSE